MAQFIQPQNQTILWQTLQKHPLIPIIFPESDHTSHLRKESWFKSIISSQYLRFQNTYLTREQVVQLNKDTLQILINDLKMSQIQTHTIAQIHEQQINNTQINMTDSRESRESILQNKTNEFQRELDNKRKDYEQLYQKPTPPEVKFESTNDEVIKNMDELVQRQLRERENDLHILNQKYINTPLKINSESPNIQADILEIQPPVKKVSWDMTDAIESKIEELTNKYTRLLDFLESRIPNFQLEFSQFSTVSESSSESIQSPGFK